MMDIAICFLLYSGVCVRCPRIGCCLCVFRSSPVLCGPDWRCRWTCRDLLCTALGYFWTVTGRRAVKGTSFSKPNDSCPDLGGWIVYLATGRKLFSMPIMYKSRHASNCLQSIKVPCFKQVVVTNKWRLLADEMLSRRDERDLI